MDGTEVLKHTIPDQSMGLPVSFRFTSCKLGRSTNWVPSASQDKPSRDSDVMKQNYIAKLHDIYLPRTQCYTSCPPIARVYMACAFKGVDTECKSVLTIAKV